MSKLNIQKNEWLELVFEGKNKNYGAYVLRQESAKTTIKAFFSGLLGIAIISGLSLVLSSFSKKETILKPDILDETVVLAKINPKKKKVALPKVIEKTISKKMPITTDLVNVKPVEANTAPEVAITPNTNLNQNTNTSLNSSGNENGNTNNSGNGTTITDLPIVEPTGPVPAAILDKMPMFPGGLLEFNKQVGKKFVSPDLEEEKIMKVIVFFVIEKDGSLSNINVPRDPGFGVGAEAIRVLKSIKTKWEPGILNGKQVRTNFSLPIVIKTE